MFIVSMLVLCTIFIFILLFLLHTLRGRAWGVPDAPAVSGVGGVYTLGVINLVGHGVYRGGPREGLAQER